MSRTRTPPPPRGIRSDWGAGIRRDACIRSHRTERRSRCRRSPALKDPTHPRYASPVRRTRKHGRGSRRPPSPLPESRTCLRVRVSRGSIRSPRAIPTRRGMHTGPPHPYPGSDRAPGTRLRCGEIPGRMHRESRTRSRCRSRREETRSCAGYTLLWEIHTAPPSWDAWDRTRQARAGRSSACNMRRVLRPPRPARTSRAYSRPAPAGSQHHLPSGPPGLLRPVPRDTPRRGEGPL